MLYCKPLRQNYVFHIYGWWVILGELRVNNFSTEFENWPTGARNRSKATVKYEENILDSSLWLIIN